MTGVRIAAALAALTTIGCPEEFRRDLCEHPPQEVKIIGEPTLPRYSVTRVVDGLTAPTTLAFDTLGRLFVLEGSPGREKQLRVFDTSFQEIARVALATAGESVGLLVVGEADLLYVASRGRIDRIARTGDHDWSAPPTPVVDGLPQGEHTNNNMALGPDGLIYFGLGSTCDVCDERDPRSATILRFDPKTTPASVEVFARGMRNPFDVKFARSGQLFATDNGPDCCAGSTADCRYAGPDRFLAIEKGGHYGWPYVFQEKGAPVGTVVSQALVDLPVHAGVAGFALYEGDGLCDTDRGDAFVALWGTQHAETESGRRVVRIKPGVGRMETFLGPSGVGRPIGVAVSPKGGLFVLDYLGFVLRVTATNCGR